MRFESRIDAAISKMALREGVEARGGSFCVASMPHRNLTVELDGKEGEAVDRAGTLHTPPSLIDNARNTSPAACNFYFCVHVLSAGALVRSFVPLVFLLFQATAATLRTFLYIFNSRCRLHYLRSYLKLLLTYLRLSSLHASAEDCPR